MTRIDFYQISDGETELQFVCRLTGMIYRRGHRIHIHTGNTSTAEALDEMLWDYHSDRFIPHSLYGAAQPAPIRIGISEDPDEHQEVLINLSGDIPEFFGRFDRVAEVVPVDQNSRTRARENYRFYKDRGYELDYHLIPARPNG